MRIETAEKLHKELWDWLAKTGKRKADWPGWNNIGLALNRCFACEYCKNDCFRCPINWSEDEDRDWSDMNAYCEQNSSPYFEWIATSVTEERKRLAAIIRDLPWRKP